MGIFGLVKNRAVVLIDFPAVDWVSFDWVSFYVLMLL